MATINYQNKFILSGFVAKPPSLKPITKGRHSLVLVIKTQNQYGEDCFIRAITYEKKIIDEVVNMGINENHFIQIEGCHDVIKWEDIKTQTVKSRPSLIIQKVSHVESMSGG